MNYGRHAVGRMHRIFLFINLGAGVLVIYLCGMINMAMSERAFPALFIFKGRGVACQR